MDAIRGATAQLDRVSERVNHVVARSVVGKYFRLEGSGHPLERRGSKFTTELRAGVVTFTAMAYILSVNANTLSLSGGPCVCNNPDNFCRTDSEYQQCKNGVTRAYVVATAAASCLASGLMGLGANMPLGLAPGLGVNAYFALTIVGTAGTGLVSYGRGLAAVWLEGWIFFILSLFGVRQWLARSLPNSLRLSAGAGIGLYLALVGLGASGLGVVGVDMSTMVGLAGCPSQYQDPETGVCQSHVLQDPRVWVGIFLGGVLTALLLLYRVRGALIIGIILVSVSSWPRGSAVTQFPYTPEGDDNWNFFKKVATWKGLSPLGPGNIEWTGYNDGHVWLALISMLYIDLLDTTGTLYAMANKAGLTDYRTGDFEGSATAYMCDALSISCGSLLGCSPCTAFIESASGIAEGGRTGITALVVSFMFFLSLFFAPIFSSLPPWATGSVLVIVGSMMMASAAEINWYYMGDALPAFLTIAGIPFMYNIAYGLIAGIIGYILLNTIPWCLIKITRGYLTPPGWHTEREPLGSTLRSSVLIEPGREYTKWQLMVLRNSILPPWLKKLLTGNMRFWQMTPREVEDYLEGRRLNEKRQEMLEKKHAEELKRLRGVEDEEAVEPVNEDHESAYKLFAANMSPENPRGQSTAI
ncbi:hypothetical protein MCUN1_001683 [Malassezia cuniculi]|uniref:Purine transporter n=1 Tax=Malassezia cuniculi TaxID=948313 RepID=A0AAF0ETH4_9BASI|nr:hypothetical protein MCUN1_001683 [Malassezia cuniculi]